MLLKNHKKQLAAVVIAAVVMIAAACVLINKNTDKGGSETALAEADADVETTAEAVVEEETAAEEEIVSEEESATEEEAVTEEETASERENVYKKAEDKWQVTVRYCDNNGKEYEQHRYNYDSDGNVQEEAKCNLYGEAIPAYRYWYEYSYDSAGNVQERICYDYLGNIVNRYEYSYDSAGNLVKEIGYDGDGSEAVLYWHEYSYDSAGNMLEETEYDSGGSVAAAYRYEYSYDSEGKVVEKICYDEDGDIANRYEYSYTSAGNLVDEMEYDRGYLSSRSEYNREGNILEKIFLDDGDADYWYQYSYEESALEADSLSYASSDEVLDAFLMNEIPLYYETEAGQIYEGSWSGCAKGSGYPEPYTIGERVDLDNDGENELIINGANGGFYVDARDGKVYELAREWGTASMLFYTYYDNAYWVVHCDTTHSGRDVFELTKYNGGGNVVDEFELSAWYSENDYENGEFKCRDEEISMEEFEALRMEIYEGIPKTEKQLMLKQGISIL